MIKKKILRSLNKITSSYFPFVAGIIIFTGLSSCDLSFDNEPPAQWDTLTVTASAYNSVKNQTQGNPNITAWGDTLEPQSKVIAVSRDLLRKGLDYNTPVKIEGFKGIFLVKDKMHNRWKNKIDIYMGKDVKKAKDWGRKKLDIYYLVVPDSLESDD